MQSTAKKYFVNLVKFAFPIALVSFLVWRIEPEQWEQLTTQPKNYWLLAAALVVALGAMSMSFARWCVLVRCQGIELSMLEAFRLGSIGYLLSFVSAGSVGGDLFKAIFLAKRRPGKRVAAVASVFVDRGSGMYGLLLLVAAGLLFSNPPAAAESAIDLPKIKIATAVLIAVGTTVLAVLILGGRSIDRLISWGSTLPVIGPVVKTIGPPLRMFHHHPFAFGLSILMSLGVQGMLVISMYLVARGMYASPPTLADHFVIVPIGMLASALPITPAGMGVLELVVETLYRSVPAIPTEASGTLVALVFEIVKVVMAVIGTVFYWTAGAEVRESIEQAEEQSEEGGEEGADSDEIDGADPQTGS
ncbi:hypothetical protein Poly51_50680 [Rubripirellula tenax]|uniref:Uncharacterized protein n=1 Tax=Rubripirellula tenax TaxID=2528015 RepID=A0A5C6EJ38_9BACT|nr:lysylphosphatidylglycerol synthase transmembrane domain-containing protein [Rubripirellula tenax]TWU47269.1 hypothetical protein Poly51_50680 [Rubripirellula tenax]